MKRFVKESLIIIVAATIIFTASFYGTDFLMNNKLNPKESKYLQNVPSQPLSEAEIDKSVWKDRVQTRDSVIEIMHEMANTLIIPIDGEIWGETEITEKKVNALINFLIANYDSESKKLLEILQMWKERNFSDAVDQHNYLWKKLKGNVGKAKSLKEGLQ